MVNGEGKTQDWEVHMLGHAVSAITDATHGMTLAAVSPAYYRHIMDYAPTKFARFAHTVWDIPTPGKGATIPLTTRKSWPSSRSRCDFTFVWKHVK